ncbi:hypothetical protein [Oceaniglobus ichthyenteri]|uniref:hypothetical protein n=1 Tax=Oceaniglobus ichthyenteri TaxID=2136177 RepID=UPI000D3AD901|nr:hypothetical protein [Oceaniglobus ichthyenteri]
MAETDQDRAVDLGIYAKPPPAPVMSDGDKLALVLALLWLIGTGIFFLMLGTGVSSTGFDPLRLVTTLLAIFLPVALIWVGAAAMRSARVMREESARLHLAIDGIRAAYLKAQKTTATGASPEVARKLNEIVEQQKKTETVLATFISIRPQTPPLPPAPAPGQTEQQASLALGTPADSLAQPLATADFISALQFPENPEDKDGFRALRRALQDRRAAQLVQAAQDVLTLLSQDGIYMDDLRPDRARPDIWRKFAQGERGRAVAPLGGIRDRSSLALSAARMRSDAIFRDACHHFLRKFDHTFVEFEKTASDAEIAALTDTRTARAFMLLGRVTGTFD